MELKHFLSCVLIFAVSFAIPMQAQSPSGPPKDSDAPLLTLDDAVSLAVRNNRLVQNSVLESQKHDFRVNTARSNRLPHFEIDVLAGQLLRPFDFTFPAGSFGNFAQTGRIPANDAKIRTPSQLTTFVTGGVDQPLSQQYKIGLAIRATKIGRQIAVEDVRAERQKIAAQVRNAYLNLVATQAGVDAARESVAALEEAQRVTAHYRVKETVLKADALEVDARLAQSRYELSLAENGLSTQREHLNQLLGRDLTTRFRVDVTPEEDVSGISLETARKHAFDNRPEIRQAHLKEEQAAYDRRIAKAEYIPDISLSVRYMGFNNFQVIPGNVAVAGVHLNWEPFDWGRRHNAVAEKSKTLEQAHNGAHETEAQVAVEVGAKYRKWQEAALLLKATKTGHEAATELLRVTSNRYKEQAALIKDLLQVQARSTETEYQYQQALSSYWSALADLRRAMGDE